MLQEEPPTPRGEEEQFAPLPALDLGSLDALQQELDAKVTASYAPVPKPYRPWEDLTPSNAGRLGTLQALDHSVLKEVLTPSTALWPLTPVCDSFF